ncbi:hypothetical protein SLEP1_g34567 [Rubroshorea leprosula]|uniref:methylmalonate-semialdehyde dehydrogenase (CoA acylating) n=1 Tax=Rubroshorea leprosula TaxID=152421 RepID=A0AAV5KKC9_9ROSI|nr:hypothetical protein SLEP1_g34567 [Rubroshorea leprosula]
MESQSQLVVSGQNRMLPPPPATFQDREDLIKHARDFGASQGYVVTIKKSRKDRRVILGCDRGGVYRNRRKIDETKRKRKASSRLINCPFEAIGKKEDDVWLLTIKNGDHNHEPLKDMSEHPYSRRFTEEEVRQIKLMTEAGVKPRQVLKTLKQSNPELQSTPRHLYNLKAKIRQGNLTEKSFKSSWIPNRSVLVNSGESLRQNNQPLKVPNFIGGRFVESQGSAIIEVINPATQEVVSQVPLTTYEEFKDAVDAAKQALPSWKNTPIVTRQRIMFKLQEFIRRDIDKLAMNITIEQGKALKSARGDVLHGLEVVEHACGMATLQMGEFVPNASNGIDTYCIREPVGVCAGICSFNFPATIPLWMFPIAVACGNTFVLKTCEKNPGASMILGALAKEAGLPDGVLNIVHGTSDIINYICDDEDIKAVSFFGSTMAGMHVHARAAARGKQVQSNVAGKNHAIVMPDASMEATLNALVAAGFGAVGQRCMASITAIFVGGSIPWEELVERAKALKINVGTDASADIGPVISKEAKDHISRLVQSSVDAGARLLLDGRNVVVPGYENGNFIGPTILCDVTLNMECYKDDIFGPVLICMQVESLEEAIAIVNKTKSLNGASIFTSSGYAARKFQNEIDAGLVGINVPVPIPMPFSSNGPKASFAGDLNFCGKSGVQFYTQIKMVAQQWGDLPTLGVSSGLQPSSETDMTSRGVSSALRPSSERDSPSQRTSPAMSPASENDLSGCGALTLVPSTSERDPPNPGGSSLPLTADADLPSRNTSDIDLSNKDNSLATTHPSERMYMPQPSQWKETPSLTSQRTEPIAPPPERIYMPMISQKNSNAAPTVQRTDNSLGLTHERVFMATSHKNDSMVPVSHRNNGIAQTSHSAAHPASERIYMMTTSNLSDGVGHTFQRTEDTFFPTSERIYMAAVPHRNDHIGSTSQRADVTLQPPSERVYIPPAPQRADNIASPSHRADAVPPTSESMYLSPIIQRNPGVPPSERLYMPATSQRMYNQNQVMSMDDYSGQGPSINVPASQRI